MATDKSGHLWTIITVLLVFIIIAGCTIIWSQFNNRPIEISIERTSAYQAPAHIYISGAVANPGIYPLKDGDSLPSVVQAAGGTTSKADTSLVKLHIPLTGELEQPQKVNINQAETWLLEALPGIGETRASAIIAYRLENGPFQNINEITRVPGLSITTYRNIQELITVAD